MRLTKKYENGTFGVADTLPCGENSHDFKKLLINNLGWYEERDLAQSAIKATESPSVAAAVEGLILTEEELDNIHDDIYGSLDKSERAMLYNLIASHRSLNSRNAKLVHENDELMAENMKLRDLVLLANSLIPSGNSAWTKALESILEGIE